MNTCSHGWSRVSNGTEAPVTSPFSSIGNVQMFVVEPPIATSRWAEPSGATYTDGSRAPWTPSFPHVTGMAWGTNGPVGDDEYARPTHRSLVGSGGATRCAA